jgi:hypothetical protein
MTLSAGMFRRQAGFAVKTVRHVARKPALAREFPRLLRTAGRGPMHLRLPWLPFRLIDELEVVVRPGSRVFEYGGGGSTLWFLDQGAVVVTVEHDRGWVGDLERSIASSNWTLLARSITDGYADYVGAISSYPDNSFDVVLVDGRARGRCVKRSLRKIASGGLLVVDDIDLIERAAEALKDVGWPRRDFVGFAPGKIALGHTAVLTRP